MCALFSSPPAHRLQHKILRPTNAFVLAFCFLFWPRLPGADTQPALTSGSARRRRKDKMNSDSAESKRAMVNQFLSVTGTTDAAAAETLLLNNGWDVVAAIECVLQLAMEEEGEAEIE